MKHLTITLKRSTDGAEIRAQMDAWYDTSDWPSRTEWKGDRKAFALEHGHPPGCLASLENLEKVVAFQASQSGADFEIIDHGGEAPMRIDNVLGSEQD